MKFLIIPISLLLLPACATQKVLQATGGSRSDGIIEMAYEVGSFEKPVIDWELTRATARDRCTVWGYSDAELFGGQTSECSVRGDAGCLRSLVTVKYQCIGDLE